MGAPNFLLRAPSNLVTPLPTCSWKIRETPPGFGPDLCCIHFFLGIIIINFLNRFLATGDTQTTLAFSYRVGQSTLNNIIMEGCAAIWETLMPRVLKPPGTQDEWRKIAAEFHVIWNFPMCIGALDGKHVMIQAPFHAGSEYYNYIVFHSIVLLALCDAQ